MFKKATVFFLVLVICLSAIFASFRSMALVAPQQQQLLAQTKNLDSKVFSLAQKAHQAALQNNELTNPDIITIIDYSKPSYEKRLWVLDLKSKKVLYHTYVAHGVTSGQSVASQFSNIVGSKQTSIGVFKTGDTYVGKHGRSLNIHGLEEGVNSNAYKRRVVIHAAPYVGEAHAARKSIGRSHGCPALAPHLTQPIIQKIKHGSLLFAYYPDSSWLKGSGYL